MRARYTASIAQCAASWTWLRVECAGTTSTPLLPNLRPSGRWTRAVPSSLCHATLSRARTAESFAAGRNRQHFRLLTASDRITRPLRAQVTHDAELVEHHDDQVGRVELEATRSKLGAHRELVMVVLEQLTQGDEVPNQRVARVVRAGEVAV